MSELPPDPFVFDWPNNCRTCERYELVNKAGYCSRLCECEDMLSSWTNERVGH